MVRMASATSKTLAFAPDLSGEYEVTPIDVDMKQLGADAWGSFFKNLYQQHVNIAGLHDKMYVCFILAGHDARGVDTVRQLTSCVNRIKNANFIADVMVLAPELARLTEEKWRETIDGDLEKANQLTMDVLRALSKLRRSSNVLGKVMMIQDTNTDRRALRMDEETLAELLAWKAVAMAESMPRAQAIDLQEEDRIASFGLSCVSFDRYYYLHFLLHHAYLSVMEREGVQNTHVEVNKVANVAQRCMAGREQVLTEFWNTHVAPRLNAGEKRDVVIPAIRENMERFIAELEEKLTSFLPDEQLSLPEKRAVMAQILLSDDDILAGSLFDTKQLTFLDMLKEPLAFFVDYNNLATTFYTDEAGHILRDTDTNEAQVNYSALCRPRREDGLIHLPVDDIKALRIKIREASEYIRRMDEEIEGVQRQQNAAIVAQQVVVGGGFQFDSTRFKAVQNMAEEPLKDNYLVENVTTESNVDLSADFPVVKNQAEIGACAAFAVTAVMEYILKKNKSLSSNLSERFVYYNVREQYGRLGEQGAAVSEVINSMGKRGVCAESLCPYSKEHVDDRPSEEAYTEALRHRIVEAKNMPLSMDIQHNLELLKTAIAEGYPVIASFKVFNEMELGLPFVPMPTQDPEEGENHAMVICGFDDETGFFKVRNSWGTAFGEKGYCYMPYAYVGQKKFVNAAYVITQIASSDHVKGVATKHRISFDSTDTAIKMAILSSLRDLNKVQQEQWLETYRGMYADLVHLNGNLKNKAKRDEIVDAAKAVLEDRRNEQNGTLVDSEMRMGKSIEDFRTPTRWTAIVMSGAAVVFALVAYILTWVTRSWGIAHTFVSILAGLDVLALFGYLAQRRHDLAALKNRWRVLLDEQGSLVGMTEKEMKMLDMRAFVAGMLIDNLTGLHDNLSRLNVSMKSYVNNLSVWYEEEKRCVKVMSPEKRPPFIALLNNEVLFAFFKERELDLIAEIRLWELMKRGDYDIGEESVARFKGQLKNTILEKLDRELGDFSVYDFMMCQQSYSFLRYDKQQFNQMLSSCLHSYSRVLMPQANDDGNAGILILLNHPTDQTANLCRMFRPYCHTNPQCATMALNDALLAVQTQEVAIDNISL